MKGKVDTSRDLPFHIASDFFAYDPETGIVTWKRKASSQRNVVVGSEAGNFMYGHSGYRQLSLFGRRYLVHRVAWTLFHGLPPEGVVDHANGRCSDNRSCNLRIATPVLNLANSVRKKPRQSPKGVSKIEDGVSWSARIKHNGVSIYLGSFSTPEEAHLAYMQKANDFYGEFARSA